MYPCSSVVNPSCPRLPSPRDVFTRRAAAPSQRVCGFFPFVSDFGLRISDFPLRRAAPLPPGVFALKAVFWIRCVDVAGGQTRGLEPRAGYISGRAEPFYGTMVGPWWYHTATIVPRVRNLPFSALRLLIQLTRKPSSCRPCKDRTASLRRPGLLFCILPSRPP
jgi:hypothetical protein